MKNSFTSALVSIWKPKNCYADREEMVSFKYHFGSVTHENEISIGKKKLRTKQVHITCT